MSDSNSATSIEDSPPESESNKLKQSKEARDAMHWITIVCFLTCTTFWLAALFICHPKPWLVIQNASVALSICFVLDATVACMSPAGLKTRLILMHFSLGVLQNALYVIFFVTSPTLFAEVWSSIFFGYYLWTWTVLLTQRQELFPMFRIFYTVHHTLAFFITGTWMIVSPCCSEDDNDVIYRGMVIWLSSDIWNYLLNIYRSLRPKTDKNIIRKMQTIIFGIERIHRSLAYFQALTVPFSSLNTLSWVVLGTTLFIDGVDASFQLHSLCKHYQGTNKQSKKSATDVEDVEDVESVA